MFQTQLLLSHLTIGKFQNAKNKFPTIIQAGELEFLVVVRVRWMILVHLLLNAHWTSSAMSGLVLGLVGAKKIQFQSSIRAGKPGDILVVHPICRDNRQGRYRGPAIILFCTQFMSRRHSCQDLSYRSFRLVEKPEGHQDKVAHVSVFGSIK